MVNNEKVITSDWLSNYVTEEERSITLHLYSLNVLIPILWLWDQNDLGESILGKGNVKEEFTSLLFFHIALLRVKNGTKSVMLCSFGCLFYEVRDITKNQVLRVKEKAEIGLNK